MCLCVCKLEIKNPFFPSKNYIYIIACVCASANEEIKNLFFPSQNWRLRIIINIKFCREK